jgi:hypothetical protein
VTLDELLGACYTEIVIRGAPAGTASFSTIGAPTALRQAIVDDPAFAAEARARLETLRQIPEERCFVSARHRRYLEAALGQART